MSKKLYEEVGGLNIDQYTGETGVEVQLTKGLDELIHLTEEEVRQVIDILSIWLDA